MLLIWVKPMVSQMMHFPRAAGAGLDASFCWEVSVVEELDLLCGTLVLPQNEHAHHFHVKRGRWSWNKTVIVPSLKEDRFQDNHLSTHGSIYPTGSWISILLSENNPENLLHSIFLLLSQISRSHINQCLLQLILLRGPALIAVSNC